MSLILGIVGTICLSCWGDDPLRPRARQVEVLVEQAIPDGCARFQIHANPAQSVTVDSIYGTQYCQTDELKLIQDSAAVFDAATGKLRIPIVVKNVGTRAVRGLLKIRYDADSVKLFDTNGNPVAGPTNIVGLGDSTLNNGRVAYWGYIPILQPAGELQVLFAGQTSRRRWLELQGTDWDKSVKIKLFTTAKYEVVPATVPTHMPNYAGDSLWLVRNPAGGGFPYVRDHLMVRFWASASAASRQQAIDLVGGVVVGGTGDGQGADGEYFVRIPPDPSEQRISQAITMLKSQPAVLSVLKDFLLPFGPTHLRPTDGTGWSQIDWKVGSANYGHSLWGLEYLRFPLAWGCETGDSTLRIGVLDEGFSLNAAGMADVRINVVDSSKSSISWNTPHGAWVASVLGARGNNLQGIAGGAWRGALDLRHPVVLDTVTGQPVILPKPDTAGTFYAELTTQFRRMVSAGDRVVNISLGADSLPLFSLQNAGKLSNAQAVVGALAAYVRFGGASTQPANVVLVVSAGNVPNGDPRESLFPLFKDEIPNQVIVVRGMDKSGQLSRSVAPAGQAYVDFAAPGQDIGALDPSGAPISFSGSSAATPLVSGMVALMRSFLPSLPADSVLYYLRSAAAVSGNSAGGFPIPDAYEVLKLLAQRVGAPICGNAVFTNTAYDGATGSKSVSVLVKRAASMEPIYFRSMPIDSSFGEIAVTHGGKELLLLPGYFPPNVRLSRQIGSGWQAQTLPLQSVSSPSLTGSTNSAHALSHDGDTTFYTSAVDNPPLYNTATFSFGVSTAGIVAGPIAQYPNLADTWTNPISNVCCYGGGATAGGTISPTGTFAVVVTRAGSDLATWHFDRISLPGGTKTPLFSETSKVLPGFSSRPFTAGHLELGMSISEDGTELLYFVSTDYESPFSCIAKRYSLKTLSALSSDTLSSGSCAVQAGGSPRRRTPIITSR